MKVTELLKQAGGYTPEELLVTISSVGQRVAGKSNGKDWAFRNVELTDDTGTVKGIVFEPHIELEQGQLVQLKALRKKDGSAGGLTLQYREKYGHSLAIDGQALHLVPDPRSSTPPSAQPPQQVSTPLPWPNASTAPPPSPAAALTREQVRELTNWGAKTFLEAIGPQTGDTARAISAYVSTLLIAAQHGRLR